MWKKPLVRMVTALIIVTISAVPSWGQELSISDIYRLPHRPADHRIFYGSDSLQYADLRLPSGSGPFPVAIIIHGGCWLASVATLEFTAPLSDALRNEGIVTWNVEYSRVGDPNGGWPGTFKDLALATDHLRQIDADYNLDLDRVIVIGHSAGGHLALWIASRHKISPESDIYRENPLKMTGVVNLAGPVDMGKIVGLVYDYCGDSVITKLLGGLPEEVSDNYDNASPIELLPVGVPQRLIVGEHDIPILLEHLAVYTDSAIILNEDIHLDTVKNVWHNELAVPGSIAWLKVRATIKSLLAIPE